MNDITVNPACWPACLSDIYDRKEKLGIFFFFLGGGGGGGLHAVFLDMLMLSSSFVWLLHDVWT